jgi:transcriptional regulator with XRE-family HTH domain
VYVAHRVASLIERERLARDLDYRQLGKVLGVSHSTAYDWANGKHQPNLKSLKKIAKRLGIAIAELVS